MASTPTTRSPKYLRSLVNGERWPVPPDATPELIAELIKRGVMRDEDEPKGKRNA